MSQDLSMTGSVNRIRNDLREKEEKRNQQRRRNLLRIISTYLNCQGYTKSSATLVAEAQLSSSIQICDNIDLEIILRDYEQYYHLRFNKYPLLCKTVDVSGPVNLTMQSHAAETQQNERKLNNTNIPEKKKKEDIDDLSPLITLKSLFTDQILDSDPTKSHPISMPTISQSIEDLYGADSEMRKIAEVISKEIIVKDLNVKWDDVKGLSDCKTAINEAIVYPIRYPQLFQGCFSPWRGILLYGPSGTGKTMLAKATATECNCTFFNVSASSLVSKWRGDSEKYVRALFDLAYKQAPTVIFIDEIDWVAAGTENVLSEPARRFRAELLSNLDGLLSNEFANVVLLAATNSPWNIDAALLRRLEKHFFIPLPDCMSRLEILQTYVSKSDVNKDLSVINNTLKGYSGSDIKRLCKQAWMYQVTPMIKMLENKEKFQIPFVNKISSIKYLEAASKVIKPIADEGEYKAWATDHSL